MNHIQIKHLGDAAFSEHFLHGTSQDASKSGQFIDQFVYFLKENDLSPVSIRFFVRKTAFERLQYRIEALINEIHCPVTWILQPEKESVPDLTFQAHAVGGRDVQPIYDDGLIAGCRFQDRNASYLYQNVLSGKGAEPALLAAGVFETMQKRLISEQSDFSRTVRTWLFADNILSWYGQLNRSRSEFFRQHDIFNKLVPASTGIGVRNPFGAILTTELLAVEPLNNCTHIEKIASPLQCEALNYKSSFSRAVRVRTPDYSRMYVSGTASIGPDGQTEHLNDCAKQIALTMQVVEAIIRNGGMNWSNSVQAIAYFKDARDFALFDDYCRGAKLEIPHVKIEADICREDLLFELELSLVSVTLEAAARQKA